MQKSFRIFVVSLLCLGVLSPVAHAADIVTFSTNTDVTLPGSAVDLVIVSGSAADEVIIDTTTLTVDVDATDTFTLRSPDNVRLVNDGGYNACTKVSGTVQVTVTGPDTVVFTPSGRCSSGDSGGGSSSTVTSTTPVVDLLLPDADSWLMSSVLYAVTWDTSGSGIDTVKLEYSTNGGASWMQIADNVDKDDELYWWNVPEVDTEEAMIRISAQDSGKAVLDTDVSAEFEISIDDAEEPTDPSEDGITTDALGRRWAPGSGVMGASPWDGSSEEVSTVKAGWYIRGEHYSTVYYVSGDGTRMPFWDATTFMTWADSWNEVVWVSDATLQTLTLTAPVLPQPGVVLVKVSSDPRVYLVSVDAVTGEYLLRHITSESIASSMFGSAWADYVIDVESTVFTHYEKGSDVTFVEPVNSSLMETRMEIATQVAGN